MRRPLPTIPRGPRRAAPAAPADPAARADAADRPAPVSPAAPQPTARGLRIACPRVSPEWELAARLALVKPKPYTKDKIAHRSARQPWPRGARRAVLDLLGAVADVHFPRGGPDRMVAQATAAEAARAGRAARKLSRALPEVWFVLDHGGGDGGGGEAHGEARPDRSVRDAGGGGIPGGELARAGVVAPPGRFTYLRDGVFYRRSGKDKLELVRSSRVRLRRAVRFGFYGDIDRCERTP